MFFRKKIFYLFLFSSQAVATWLENIPQNVTQSNGQVINFFASGDQFYHRLHDENDFTIVLNTDDGDFYYATKIDFDIVPSSYKVGSVDPRLTELSPGIKITRDQYLAKKEFYENSMSFRNGRDAPTSGNLSQLNVFIKFADDGNFPNSRQFYDVPFNSDTEPSIKDYFYEVSYGSLIVDTYHYPPSILGTNTSYTDSRNRGYYSPYSASNPEGYQTEDERTLREHALLRNAILAIQNSVPEDLNIDVNNDGYVDALSFSVYGNVDGWSELLWPHRWALFSYDVYINGSRVYDYSFELTESSYFTAGVLCHEFFHVLGAPDLYHYNETGAPDAVGGWDIMESTSNPPQYMGAYLKWKYGDWLEEIPEITSTGVYTLNPLQQEENVAYKVASPNSDSEYYILEYRVKEGVYDSNTPGTKDGLLVYRINTLAGDGNAQGPPDEIYLYRPGGTLTSQGSFVNAPYSSDHSHTEINDFTNPEPFLYNNGLGGQGGLNLLDVGPAGENISFTISMGAPSIDLDQEVIAFSMAPNEFQAQNLLLSNGGDPSTILMFDLNLTNLPFSTPNGGPDGGGYYWSSSTSDISLPFNWVDIQNSGTRIEFPTNDDAPELVSLGFDFPFFEGQYSQCLINPNGWIGFGQDFSLWSNVEIPNADAPGPAIMAMWDDLNPLNNDGNATAAGSVYYYSDIQNERFIVWYDNVVTWAGNSVLGEFDFQIILHKNGSFELNYNEIIGSTASATIGFQDENGIEGTLIYFNQNSVQSQQSIYVSKTIDQDWLVIGTPTGLMNGLLDGGQSYNINLMVNTNGIEAGYYESTLVISSDQVDNKSISVQLEVSGQNNDLIIPYIDLSDSQSSIVDVPEFIDSRISSVFQKYTHVEGLGDNVIPILSQSQVPDNKILHVKKILQEFLMNVPLAHWGYDKSAIKNALSMSNAAIFVLRDEGEYENPDFQILVDSGIKGHNILETEICTEGSIDYMISSKMDATYKKILRFVYDLAIKNTLPSMHYEAEQAMAIAIDNNHYIPEENMSNEDRLITYLNLLLEVYFGMWGHDPNGDGFAGNSEYSFINRQSMAAEDSSGSYIISQFFGEKWRYFAELPSSFSGVFSLSYENSLSYTHRSQYLQNVILDGLEDVEIIGNQFSNKLIGNDGNNIFSAKGSDDYINGGAGNDKVIFIGDYDEYGILEEAYWNSYILSVVDLINERDGTDTLIQIEEMDFNGINYIIGENLNSNNTKFNPNDFKLFPTYPNPFNSSTNVKFHVPKTSFIKIIVVDLLGRKIKTLFDGEIKSGVHKIKWDGFDNTGKLIPSGVYLIHFISQEYMYQYKTVLIK